MLRDVLEISNIETLTLPLATASVFAVSNEGLVGVVYAFTLVVITGVEFPKIFVDFTYMV